MSKFCSNCETKETIGGEDLCQPCLDDKRGMMCPKCESHRTHKINSWSGYNHAHKHHVSIEQHGCADCGNRWMY